MVIPGSCDIRFLCSNIRIESNNPSYDIELKNQDFETQVERHEEVSKFEEGLEKEPVSHLKCSYLARVISDFLLQTCESKLTTLAMIWN